MSWVLFLERYVRDLTSHMTAYLVEMSNKNDLKNFSQQPDIILSVGAENSGNARSF